MKNALHQNIARVLNLSLGVLLLAAEAGQRDAIQVVAVVYPKGRLERYMVWLTPRRGRVFRVAEFGLPADRGSEEPKDQAFLCWL